MVSTTAKLAALGGQPVRRSAWPSWPRADRFTEEAVTEVLRSERWTISGPCASNPPFERRFAEAFARFHDVPFCVPTANGSAALVVALEALGVGPGQEVLVPGLTWVACASAVTRIGAIPLLVDVDPKTLCMSVEAARQAITPSTAAILLVHLYCMLGDIEGFLELSAATGIPLVEDCSHAHGAVWRGRKVGSFGAVGAFSMQQTKVLTSGEGGATITSAPHLFDRLQQLRADGRRYSAKRVPGTSELENVGDQQGHNYCLSELHSAILLDRLSHLENENEIRRKNATLLTNRLQGVNGITALPAITPDVQPALYCYCIRFDGDLLRDASVDNVAVALTAELGISVGPIYDPLNANQLFRPHRASIAPDSARAYNPEEFALPVAEAARREVVAFPHRCLLGGSEEIEDIAKSVEKILTCKDVLHQVPA